jgi:hypothetical protein
MTKIYLVENCYGDPNKVYIGKTINSRELNHKKTYGKYIFKKQHMVIFGNTNFLKLF